MSDSEIVILSGRVPGKLKGLPLLLNIKIWTLNFLVSSVRVHTKQTPRVLYSS